MLNHLTSRGSALRLGMKGEIWIALKPDYTSNGHKSRCRKGCGARIGRSEGNRVCNRANHGARIGNVAYGVSKAATDKMTADMAEELEPPCVAVISFIRGW